jgi:hypothetical protein
MAMFLLSLFFAAHSGPFILLTGEGWPHWVNPSELPKTGWFALFDDGKGPASLRRSKLVIVKDDRLSDEHLVTIDSAPKGALILFRGIPNLKEGEVTPALWENEADDGLLRPDTEIKLDLGKRRYQIALRDAVVTLSGQGRRQELFRLSGPRDGPHFEVLWAGDLDGDGRIDLLMTMSDKYSAYPRQLFLSGAAKAGELVHQVAEFDDLSC